jgi:tetratricopeptide (TPR) repeat protein
MLGRPDIALAWARVQNHLENQPASAEFTVGDCWTELGEDGRAEKAYRHTIALRPELPEGWMGLCRLKLLQGNFIAAREVWSENEKNFSQFEFASQMTAQSHFFSRRFREAMAVYSALAQKDPDGGGNFYGAISYQSALGWLHLGAGEKELGRNILNAALQHELAALKAAPRHPEILYRTAAIESALGLRNSSLDHLRAAAAEGWIDFRSLGLDPRFDAVRAAPKFKQISESIATKVASLRRSLPTDLTGEKEGPTK